MSKLKLNKKNLDRRSFVAASAGAIAALSVSATLCGCGNRVTEVENVGVSADTAEGATWKTLACLHGCGQRCMNQALVKDGIVIRQKTDDTHDDSIEYPQQRGCLRGRCLYEFERTDSRLKYPMKRVSWSPDDPNGELRGKEGYEVISWDEALDYVAAELKKSYQTYGPRSIFVPTSLSGGRPGYGPLLNALGGYLTVSDPVSYGTYTANTDALGISWGGERKMNDRLDMIENADVIVLYGQNPGWGANGNPTFNFRAAKEHGAKFVVVGPEYNVSAGAFDALWIPVKPGTDTALLIGVAGEMLKLEEEKGGIIDWDFLHKYCIGFDDESRAEDAKSEETYRGYLEGKYDGTVKDAAWASEICGTPEKLITQFAELVGKKNNCVLSHGYAGARCNGAEDLPQAYMAIACMGGHFGKPGNSCGNLYVDRQGPGGVQIISTGGDGMDDFEPEVKPLYDASKVQGTIENDFVNSLDTWNAVIEGKYRSTGDCWDGVYNEPVTRTCDIHVIYMARDGGARSVPNGAKAAEAFRKVDFVCAQGYALTPSTVYADIILPTLAKIETYDLPNDNDRDREMLLVYSPVSEAPYEAKDMQWVSEQILQRLGYDSKEVFPYSTRQRFFNRLANTTIADGEGETNPLVTITAEDIKDFGVTGEPQEGVISFKDLLEKGIYQVKRAFGDEYQHIAYKDFIDDPKGHPLDSASGKFELTCQAKADTLNTAAMAGEHYEPYPTYHEFAGEGGSAYPMLMFSSHYPRTACSDFGNVRTLREAFTAPVQMNASDAEEHGITSGDYVIVSSPSGQILRQANVSQLVIPGAIDVPNGPWQQFDANGNDVGGCPNTLYGGTAHGMGVSGYNNVHVKVEKWTGKPPVADCDNLTAIGVSGEKGEQ